MHVGTPHEGPIPHSGRYPFGSGENAYQRHQDLYSTYRRELAKGTSKKDIASMCGFVDRFGNPDVKRLEAEYSMATRQIKAYQTAEIKRLHDEEGMGWTEIGNKLGLADTTVISRYRSKNEILTRSVAAENALKAYVDKYKYVDQKDNDREPRRDLGIRIVDEDVNDEERQEDSADISQCVGQDCLLKVP